MNHCTREFRNHARLRIGRLTLGLVLTSASLGSCSTPPPTDSASALLTVPVRASQPQMYVKFNDQIATALLHGEDWPKDATLVALRFASWGTHRLGALSSQGAGERPSRYHVVAISDNLLDDSVRGRRIALDIERQADNSWRIVDAQSSWRCWRKADDSFGVDRCP